MLWNEPHVKEPTESVLVIETKLAGESGRSAGETRSCPLEEAKTSAGGKRKEGRDQRKKNPNPNPCGREMWVCGKARQLIIHQIGSWVGEVGGSEKGVEKNT